jgi:antitoxin MazE
MREGKVVQIGNSKGIRIPKALLLKYGLEDDIVMEERAEGLLIKAKGEKLSWEATYRAIAEEEDWSDWQSLEDGWEALD